MRIYLILLFFLSSFFFPKTARKDLNLLTGAFKQENLKASLGNDKSWVPYPAYSDRLAWDKLMVPLKSVL
jgi:hypothetical protein